MLGHHPISAAPISGLVPAATTTFQAAWARGCNVLLRPGVGVLTLLLVVLA
jgi:hypothetical protein